MRIFVIHNFYQDVGGEDEVFRQEVEELSRSHQVKVYTPKNKKGLSGVCQFLSYPFNLSRSKKIVKSIKRFNPDVIHIHNLHYAIGPWVIREIHKLGLPVVMTLHNYRLLCPSASLFHNDAVFTQSLRENFPWTAVKKRVLDDSYLKTFITAFTYWFHRKIGTWSMVSQYIVLSEFAKKLFSNSTFPKENFDQFTVRPNSIDATPIESEHNDRFIYIGRLSEEKGILQLLSAIAPLEIQIEIYGKGPLVSEVEKFSKKYKHIEYKGFVPSKSLSSVIAQSGALIVPSICYEGMPMTIIEGYAQGTPVLASRIGILEEMVVPLYTGLLFDPFQPGSIQHTIQEWMELTLEQKTQIRKNCNAEYHQHYRLDNNLHKLLAIYEKVIAK